MSEPVSGDGRPDATKELKLPSQLVTSEAALFESSAVLPDPPIRGASDGVHAATPSADEKQSQASSVSATAQTRESPLTAEASSSRSTSPSGAAAPHGFAFAPDIPHIVSSSATASSTASLPAISPAETTAPIPPPLSPPSNLAPSDASITAKSSTASWAKTRSASRLPSSGVFGLARNTRAFVAAQLHADAREVSAALERHDVAVTVFVPAANVVTVPHAEFLAGDVPGCTACKPESRRACMRKYAPSWAFASSLASVLIPTLPPIIFIGIGLGTTIGTNGPPNTINASSMAAFIAFDTALGAMYLIFLLVLIILGVALVHTTNESSVSGMVAQRYKKLSYLTILAITGVSFFTSSLMLSNGMLLARQNTRVNASLVLCATFSPVIFCCILIFPLVVTKTSAEMEMVPLDVPLVLGNADVHAAAAAAAARSAQAAVSMQTAASVARKAARVAASLVASPMRRSHAPEAGAVSSPHPTHPTASPPPAAVAGSPLPTVSPPPIAETGSPLPTASPPPASDTSAAAASATGPSPSSPAVAGAAATSSSSAVDMHVPTPHVTQMPSLTTSQLSGDSWPEPHELPLTPGGHFAIPDNLPSYFSMSFYSGVSRSWHRSLHMLSVLFGICTGYAYVIGSINSRVDDNRGEIDATNIVLIVLISISGLCVLLFCLAALIDNGYLPPHWKQRMLFVEFLGLFYYMLSLVYTEERYLLLTGYYGRFSNRMMQVAELLAMALLLNRSVILPSGKDPVRYGGMEAVLDLPSIDALGVRRVPAERAYETCSSLDGVFAVAGVMFNGEQPGWDALAPGIVSAPPDAGDSPPALPAVTSLNRLRAEPAAGWLPDDGGPSTDAAGAARSEVWHTYPYPLLIDSTSAKRWTGAPADGIVVPGLPAALRALDPPPRCLALDSLYLTLDWRPHPALFRRVFSAVTAPTPALRAAVERLRGDGGLLGGQPYLALHLRMTDFCVRPGDWEAGGCQAGGFRRWLAPTLERMLAAAACSAGARQLLLLTDEPGHSWVEEVHAVAAAAGAVVRSVAVADSAGAAPDSEAALILLEQELAAGGECFMGGAASTFSALIRVRRDLAGRAWETMMPFQYE